MRKFYKHFFPIVDCWFMVCFLVHPKDVFEGLNFGALYASLRVGTLSLQSRNLFILNFQKVEEKLDEWRPKWSPTAFNYDDVSIDEC